MIDSSGGIVLVNREIERLFGYAREEILGKSIDMLVPDRFRGGHPGFRQGFFASPSVRAMGVGRELFGLRKDGVEVPVEIGLTPVATEEGLFVISSIVDITARKEAEQSRLRLEGQLRQAQKMEAIGTLAGGIAHDFNNILSGIVGYGELIAAGLTGQKAEDLAELLKAAMRGKLLVDRILTFSRRQEANRHPIDLGRVVEEGVRLLRSTLPASLRIEPRIADVGTRIVGDITSVQQVVMNLVTNAAYAMPLGGELAVKVENMYVRDSQARSHPDLREGPYALLTVRDSGTGIDPSIRERVFEPFFSTKPAGSGSGLGLAMVHGIMRDHDGAVLLDSVLGEGTTVRCHFPAVVVDAAEESTDVAAIPHGAGERVLYVDDEPMLARLGERKLSAIGYEVEAETDGTRALERFAAAAERYDLVVSDYLMPNLTGVELASAMTRVRPGIRILLLTGYLEDLPERDLRSAGICSVLKKPATLGELAFAVRAALDSRGHSG